MSGCPHCHGTGRTTQRNPQPHPIMRTPPRRMVPHGHATEAALQSGGLVLAPYLFCGTCPQTGKDRWKLATEHMAKHGDGSALVLPEGVDPAELRYPALPVFPPGGCALVAFAYGMTGKEERALGVALIAAGLDAVDVVGGPNRPLRFNAT